MATRRITLTVAAAALSFVAGAYCVGHIGGWLRLGIEATAPDATAQARDPAAARTATLSSGLTLRGLLVGNRLLQIVLRNYERDVETEPRSNH